jgi:hypothetical protein
MVPRTGYLDFSFPDISSEGIILSKRVFACDRGIEVENCLMWDGFIGIQK